MTRFITRCCIGGDRNGKRSVLIQRCVEKPTGHLRSVVTPMKSMKWGKTEDGFQERKSSS